MALGGRPLTVSKNGQARQQLRHLCALFVGGERFMSGSRVVSGRVRESWRGRGHTLRGINARQV